MSSRIGTEYREIKRKDGRIMLVMVEWRRDISTELKRKIGKRVRVVRKGAN